ncbi:hypothetical protein C0Z01_18210 [Photobacterium kishitanii]|uniref:Uncharacterized protein n=1 Tax=Photobacterium kishitanii TaxID=318456 RepID=A0A0B7JI18_9GAMM|nr:hypothetical protein [Photobacterium kishitanii]OBU27259.1 hypothetical protein AYY22_03190 [Photobacterium kishitanii]PSU87369.1 hypothetical protein C0W42_16550 [Photobacterium kishitanii]PSU90453.1 hypothetical protein C0W35_16350 [Photobacterium kishitanii]PSU99893.1 hypothetical protein C9J27_06490 [Photobacterium kishitanii]PSW67790.1 hypothetical protein C0Z01_18210 [Photobacterium kishitanii]
MRSLKWKLTVNSILMFSFLSSVCFNFAYAYDINSASSSAIMSTQAYIDHQTKSLQPEQNIVYHPTLGYMDYQQIWCNDNQQSIMSKYQHFISNVCVEKGGILTKNWCALSDTRQPIFYTFIANYDSSCHGNHATIVHITEMMPNTNNNTNIAREWMKIAQSLGF